MNKAYMFLLLLLMVIASGCGRQYYRNTNLQPGQTFDQDNTYCRAVSQGLAPIPTPQLQGTTTATTHGSGLMVAPDGQVYAGNYNQQTTYTNNMQTFNNLMQIGALMQSSRNSNDIYQYCLRYRGWVPISVEEYQQIQQEAQKPKAQLVFTSEVPGATIYIRQMHKQTFFPIAHKTPVTLYAPTEFTYWQPECYKAVYGGVESETICLDDKNFVRRVHFTWK